MPSTILNNGPSMLLAVAITTTSFCPPQYSPEFAQLAANRIEPIASFAPGPELPEAASLGTVQEMIGDLRKSGVPISGIADAMRVERKTVYAWLKGGDIRSANTQRVAQVHSLLTGVSGIDLRNVYRFWNTAVVGRDTLRDLLTTEYIDEAEIRLALNRLRPSLLRSMANEKKMMRQGTANAILDEIPEAG